MIDDLSGADEVRDYVIVHGTAQRDMALKLHAAIQRGGLRSWVTEYNGWLAEALSGSPALVATFKKGRVRILFYSERDARSGSVLSSDEFLQGALYLALSMACGEGMTIVVLLDGKLSVAMPALYAISAEAMSADEVMRAIVGHSANHLVRTRSGEAAFRELGAVVKQTILEVNQRAQYMVLVFGPARPATFADAVSNINRTLLAQLRDEVRGEVAAAGWLAVYGEDLESVGEGAERRLNIALKERLFGLGVLAIVVIVDSPGSIAEVSLLSQYAELCRKTIVVIDKAYLSSFVVKGPVAEVVSRGGVLLDYSVECLRRQDGREQEILTPVIAQIRQRVEAILADAMRRNVNDARA